jgi:prepilin-type N-terminal cleavage/methylation domain-containing protein
MAEKLRPGTGQKGFSLIEILMALTLFATFVSVYVINQGSSIADNQTLRDEMNLANLADEKIQEILLSPPPFNESLTVSKDTKRFDKKGFEDYEYTIEYKRLEFPDLSKLAGAAGDGNEGGDNIKQAIASKIFTSLKDNIKELLWQVSVTIKNTSTGRLYVLSTWLTNPNGTIALQI